MWDTGHQAYIHKLLTGRRYGFRDLRQAGGLSGYPNRAESEHDWIENSHASTVLSYAHGLATAFELQGQAAGRGGDRRVVAVIGDGALTGGMAYEALNNLGPLRPPGGRRLERQRPLLRPDGLAPLALELTSLRLNPSYVQTRERLRTMLRDIPGVGEMAYSGVHGLTSALREVVSPHTFFEALGVRYAGPIDGHDFSQMEQAFAHAAEWDGPDRGPRADPEGPGLRPGRGRRGPAPPRRGGHPAAAPARRGPLGRPGARTTASGRAGPAAPAERPDAAGPHLHRGLHPGAAAGGRGAPRAWWP